MEGDKTRALIVHESERAADREYLRNQLALQEKNSEIAILRQQIYTNDKFAALGGEVAAGFCKTDRMIERLDCESLKRMPAYGVQTVPCNTPTITGCGPRRGSCDGFGELGFAV
jgi:hypothetical protein